MKVESCVVGLFLSLVVYSQPKPLHIGDTIPNMQINNLINYKSSSALLSEFNGKLVILDFFATWCSSCIKRFPRLDSLQQQFGNNLQLFLVSSIGAEDNDTALTAFFKKRKKPNGQPWDFPIVVNDSLLLQLFPHTFIPHYVWIYKGKVVAITASAEITAENISAVINNQPIILPIKNDEEKKELPSNQ